MAILVTSTLLVPKQISAYPGVRINLYHKMIPVILGQLLAGIPSLLAGYTARQNRKFVQQISAIVLNYYECCCNTRCMCTATSTRCETTALHYGRALQQCVLVFVRDVVALQHLPGTAVVIKKGSYKRSKTKPKNKTKKQRTAMGVSGGNKDGVRVRTQDTCDEQKLTKIKNENKSTVVVERQH